MKHTVAEASRSKSPFRLALLQLEERLNPSGPTFDYKFTEAAIGSIVTVYGVTGQAPVTAVANHLDASGQYAIATVNSPPDPVGGVFGQGYWSVQVTVAQGWRATSILNPVLNTDNLVYDAQTFAEQLRPDILAPRETVCPPLLPGSGGESAPGNDNSQTENQVYSAAGVGYYDGQVSYSETDLASTAFASPFGQSRNWSWNTGRDYGQHVGGGWMNPNLPTVREFGGGNLRFVNVNKTASVAFKVRVGLEAAYAGQSLLNPAPGTGEITFTDESGNQAVFYDTAPGVSPAERVGQMKRFTDRSGVVTQVNAWTAQGAASEVRRSSGSVVESWQYTYGTTPVTNTLVTSVLFNRSIDGGVTWQTVQSVEYSYYGLNSANGSLNGLRSVVVHTGGLAGVVERSSYYRYYASGAMKYIVTDTAFDRLASAYGATLATADTLSDVQIAEYANRYYEYNATGTVSRAVIQGDGCSACSGGRGEYTYTYTRNPHRPYHTSDGSAAGEQNIWDIVTDEILPDGNTNKVFSASSGQVMLAVYTETATGLQRESFTEFDTKGRVLRTADAVAVTGYDTQYDDLLNKVNGNYQFLSDTDGAILENKYATVTTATATDAGDALGYLRGKSVRHGELASLATPLSSQNYYLRSGNSNTVYPIASVTRYPNDRTPAPLFTDDFSTATSNPAWIFPGTGVWQQSGGVLSQTGTPDHSVFKQAHVTGQTWGPTQEIAASIRIDTWDGGTWAKAGVGVQGNSGDATGYSLKFRVPGRVDLGENLGGSGTWVSFNWQAGVWYRMRVRIEDKILYGKVWEVGQAEPMAWMVTTDTAGWGTNFSGNPHLIGGANWGVNEYITASFDDVSVLNVGLPPGETTTNSYTWSVAAPLMPTSITVTAPTVSLTQNGSGIADQSVVVLDSAGRPIWTKDAAGFIRYTQFDLATGAVLKTIDDVNTAATADFAGLPATWTTPAGGGKHLKTVYSVDIYGRTTKAILPSGSIDYSTYNDATEEAKTYIGWTGTATTGPVNLIRRDRVGGDVSVNSLTLRYTYVETLTYAPTTIPVDAQSRPTGAEAVTNIQSLRRDYFNQSGQRVWRDEYFNLTGLNYLDGSNKPVFALGTSGVHYLRTTFAFGKRGQLNRVQTPDGTITRTVQDGQGRILSAWRGNNDTPTSGFWSPTNPAGMIQVAAYEYDNGGAGDGNLTKMIAMPGGAADRTTLMAYDWRNRLVSMKNGVEATEAETLNRPFTYFDVDNMGRTTRSRVYDGDTIGLIDADGNGVPDAPAASRLRSQAEIFYDAEGRVYRTVVTGVNQLTGVPSATQWIADAWYDRRGLLVKSRTPSGLVTKNAYDGVGRLVTRSTTDGGGDTSWADALNVIGDKVFAQSNTGYDANSNVIQTTNRERVDGQTGTGALGTSTTGVLARVTNQGFYYDKADRLTAMVDMGTNAGAVWTRPATVPTRSDTALTSSFSYDAAGRVYDVIDPMAYVNRTTYDLLGRTVTSVAGNGTTVAQTTSLSYDAGGRLLNLTAPGGAVTRFGYDTFGRNNSVTQAFGTPVARTVTTGFDNLDEVTSVTSPTGPIATPSTVTTKFSYDLAGRAQATTEAFGTPLERTTTRGYDALGRTTSVIRPGNQTTTFTFDDTLMRKTTIDPQGFSWLASFDLAGNKVSEKDALSHNTNYSYDLQNRMVSTTDGVNATTGFKYNVTGDRDTVTDARANLTQTVKDRFGRTASTVDPFGKSTVYAYDRDDRLLSVTDRLTQKRVFAYNAVDQLTSEKWYAVGGVTLVQTQNYTYNAAGDLTGASDPDGNYTLTYDALHRAVTVAEPFGLSLTFAYDAAGNRVAVTDNKGGTQASAFDVLNRLTSRSLDTATGDVRVNFAYTNRDQIDTLSRFTDLAGTVSAGQTVYGYDASDRVTAITHKKANGTAVANYSYVLDNAGRMTSRTEGGAAQAITYDDRNQVTGDAGTAFSYDATGNRTTAGTTTSTIGNRLLSDGTWTYTYNDEGELTKKSKGVALETWTYGYDQRGQMVWAEQRSTDGGTLLGRTEYSYDAFGNRVKRVQKNGSLVVTSDERFGYDGWDTAKPGGVAGTENFDVWADLSSANAVTMRRVYGAGFDQPLARVSATGVTGWYLTDRQGSVRQVLDNSGTTVGSRDYSAFGAITATSGTGLDRYGYTAREWDSTLNLQYTRMRMYDPATGRFTREDQLGLSAGDANLHRYVGNAVTLGSDPSGLQQNTDLFGYPEIWGYNNPGVRAGGVGKVFNAFEIAGVGAGTPVAPFAIAYALDLGYHGALQAFTGESHPTFTAQLANELLGNDCGTVYEELFNDIFSVTRGFQSVPSLLRGARNFGRGAWSTTGWLTGKGASGLGFRDGLYGFNRFGEGFNASLKAWLKACFAAGTPIRTPEGSRAIESIAVGDVVLSRDEFDPSAAVVAKVVEEVFVRHSLILHVHVGGQVIRTSAEHPFYVAVRGWVNANELAVGDLLAAEDGTWIAVEDLLDTGEYETVYNMRVAEHHTYFVGSPEWGFSVWAHNIYTTPENANRISRLAVVEEIGMSVKKFGTRGGAANVEKGNAVRDALAARISNNKNVASVRTEVTIPTPAGRRIYDIEVTLNDGRKIYLEVKSGSADLSTLQAAKDAFLRNQGFNITTVRFPWL